MLFALVPALLLAACTAEDVSAAARPPAKVLFVGNSFTYYNNSLHNHYRKLVAASGYEFDTPPRARIMTISGGRLPEHAGGIQNVVGAEDWDVVVLQGHSRGPIGETTAEPFWAAAREYAGYIRAQGARPVFFMTWAYSDKAEMTALLDAAYTGIGRELDAEVVPVGLAFADVTEQRPDLALRTADKRHPTLAGTYLAACTFYAALHNESPDGLAYTAGLDSADATFLQQAAWRAVITYKRRESE